MNKSTPLSDLPSMKKQSNPAYEEKENQIVSEILNEIDNSQENRNVNMEVSEQAPQVPVVDENALMQQKLLEEQQAQMQAQMQEQAQALSNKRMEDNLNSTISQDNFVNNLIEMIRQPSIVAVVVALVSLPQIDTMLRNLISGREKLLQYATVIILLVKAAIGGTLFFGLNRSLGSASDSSVQI